LIWDNYQVSWRTQNLSGWSYTTRIRFQQIKVIRCQFGLNISPGLDLDIGADGSYTGPSFQPPWFDKGFNYCPRQSSSQHSPGCHCKNCPSADGYADRLSA
jgi:hypothetical protein